MKHSKEMSFQSNADEKPLVKSAPQKPAEIKLFQTCCETEVGACHFKLAVIEMD